MTRFKIQESLSVYETVVQLSKTLRNELLCHIEHSKRYIHKYRNLRLKKGVFNFDTSGFLSKKYIKV